MEETCTTVASSSADANGQARNNNWSAPQPPPQEHHQEDCVSDVLLDDSSFTRGDYSMASTDDGGLMKMMLDIRELMVKMETEELMDEEEATLDTTIHTILSHRPSLNHGPPMNSVFIEATGEAATMLPGLSWEGKTRRRWHDDASDGPPMIPTSSTRPPTRRPRPPPRRMEQELAPPSAIYMRGV